MAYAYRRLHELDSWHWCANCSKWPTEGFEERVTFPGDEELCTECRLKDEAGDCIRDQAIDLPR